MEHAEYEEGRNALSPDVRKALPTIIGSVLQEYFTPQALQVYTVEQRPEYGNYVKLIPKDEYAAVFPRISVRLRQNDSGKLVPHQVFFTVNQKRRSVTVKGWDEKGNLIL